jgi:hypothetical protein
LRLLWRFAVATLVGFLVSCLIALASYSLGQWQGGSTLLLNVIRWSCGFAVLLGTAAAALPTFLTRRKSGLAVAIFSGSVLGLASCYVLWRFSLPIHRWAFLTLSCWLPAGVSAMLVVAFGKRASVIVGIVVFAVCAVLLHEPVYNAYVHYQQLTVAFVTPIDASTSQLEANPEKLGFLTEQEMDAATNEVMQRLRELGYGEKFRVLSLTRQDKGQNALAIVVIRFRVREDVVLPEPKASTVVYIQQSDKWEKEPSETPTLLRGIELEAASLPDETLTYFTIRYEPTLGLEGRIRRRSSDSQN